MYLLGYHLSVAAAIGFIALGGVAVEIGVVMMLYLDRALERRRESRGAAGLTREDVREAVVEGALLRLRPGHHDQGGDHRRAAADHVRQRRRLRGDAAHRRPHGRAAC